MIVDRTHHRHRRVAAGAASVDPLAAITRKARRP
jgi:hypothetical protein